MLVNVKYPARLYLQLVRAIGVTGFIIGGCFMLQISWQFAVGLAVGAGAITFLIGFLLKQTARRVMATKLILSRKNVLYGILYSFGFGIFMFVLWFLLDREDSFAYRIGAPIAGTSVALFVCFTFMSKRMRVQIDTGLAQIQR